MAETFAGSLTGVDTHDPAKERVALNATYGYIAVGGDGVGGDLLLRTDTGDTTIALDGGGGEPRIVGKPPLPMANVVVSGAEAAVRVGGPTAPGRLYLRRADLETTVRLYADTDAFAGLWAGGHGQHGAIQLHNAEGIKVATMGGSANGELWLFDAAGQPVIKLEANDEDRSAIWLGGGGRHGHVVLRDGDGTTTIHLDGKDGDIVLANADCAEDFSLAPDVAAPPGSVMSITDDGSLRPTELAYDVRVAGVVAGAGEFRPAIVMGRREGDRSGVPISISGRVACRVEAESAPIRVGDLLTSSEVAGTAMRATDRNRAFGAVIGKALAGLAEGHGRVPILVALQ